jgi:hypothetical protein
MNISITEYLFKVHKPPTLQGESRLRGLWRIISSKTIRVAAPRTPCTGAALLRPSYAPLAVGSSPRLSRANPACAGYTDL